MIPTIGGIPRQIGALINTLRDEIERLHGDLAKRDRLLKAANEAEARRRHPSIEIIRAGRTIELRLSYDDGRTWTVINAMAPNCTRMMTSRETIAEHFGDDENV